MHFYDVKGRPSIDLTMIDGKYFYTYTDYDPLNRVSHVRYYWRPAGQEQPNQSPYVWQDFGYSYTYNTKSYLLSIEDTAAPAARTWWANPTYDYLDRVTTVTKGGAVTQRTYRSTDGVVTGINTASGSTAIQNLSFKYDGLGNLRSRTGSGGSETLGYDALNRLTSAKEGAITYFDNGNIETKVGVGGETSAYSYSTVHPHAVASAFGYAMGYDANGNLISRTKSGESWSFRYAGFDKPRWMAKTVGGVTAGSEFLYNANRSRTVQLEFDSMDGSGPNHYVRKRVYGLGPTLEANYDNTAATGAPNWSLKKVRIYVPGPDGIIGSREFDPAAAEEREKTGKTVTTLGEEIHARVIGDNLMIQTNHRDAIDPRDLGKDGKPSAEAIRGQLSTPQMKKDYNQQVAPKDAPPPKMPVVTADKTIPILVPPPKPSAETPPPPPPPRPPPDDEEKKRRGL